MHSIDICQNGGGQIQDEFGILTLMFLFILKHQYSVAFTLIVGNKLVISKLVSHAAHGNQHHEVQKAQSLALHRDPGRGHGVSLSYLCNGGRTVSK